MVLPKTYLERNLVDNKGNQRFTDLAIGTHVFMVRSQSHPPAGTNHIHVMVESTGGTVDIDYTFDPGFIEDLATGTAPAQTFASGVLSQTWSTGPSADAEEQIGGPVTAVQITIATAAVNEVIIAH